MLSTLGELKQEGGWSPCSASSGNGRLVQFFTALDLSMNDHESATNTDLGVTNKSWRVGKFTNAESMNNED